MYRTSCYETFIHWTEAYVKLLSELCPTPASFGEIGCGCEMSINSKNCRMICSLTSPLPTSLSKYENNSWGTCNSEMFLWIFYPIMIFSWNAWLNLILVNLYFSVSSTGTTNGTWSGVCWYSKDPCYLAARSGAWHNQQL